MQTWKEAQEFEKNWHGNAVNSYWEETKQLVYARRMGLKAQMLEGKYPVYDMEGKGVLDIGGGAYSMLLKCINVRGVVVDPCDYPSWAIQRYRESGVIFSHEKGEDFKIGIFDEVWIYNCLQHTQNPQKIIKNARKVSKIIRLFEWIDMPICEGHIHELKEDKLNEWLGGVGKTEQLNENGCNGRCYYGIFKGDKYV